MKNEQSEKREARAGGFKSRLHYAIPARRESEARNAPILLPSSVPLFFRDFSNKLQRCHGQPRDDKSYYSRVPRDSSRRGAAWREPSQRSVSQFLATFRLGYPAALQLLFPSSPTASSSSYSSPILGPLRAILALNDVAECPVLIQFCLPKAAGSGAKTLIAIFN